MQEEIQKDEHGKILMSWKFPEYIKHQRTLGWWIGAVILVTGLLFYSFWDSNFLFGVFIITVLIIVVANNFREPRDLDFKILEDGLEIGTRFYPWEDIKNFWIIYQPPEVKTLYFGFRHLRPSIPVELQDSNPLKIRDILLKFLEEDLEQEKEFAGDELSRWLKI